MVSTSAESGEFCYNFFTAELNDSAFWGLNFKADFNNNAFSGEFINMQKMLSGVNQGCGRVRSLSRIK